MLKNDQTFRIQLDPKEHEIDQCLSIVPFQDFAGFFVSTANFPGIASQAILDLNNEFYN